MIAQLAFIACLGLGADGNRLAYLDDADFFYVHAGFPRLTTPMWFGEAGVDAAVILTIDDLTRNVERYTTFLEPILQRLREIEGRSPLSIYTCDVDPHDPRLQELLRQGVRFEVHTLTHPCPLLGKPFDDALHDVQGCIDRLAQIPNTQPAVFRMPCCDSINSASPRFFAAMLPRQTPGGHFLPADSSVLMFPDSSFHPHAPFKNFTANATGYHGPYVLPGGVWEFPILAPTDWQAQNLRGSNHPQTVADIQRALDITLTAQGLATVCFHPHGWIKNTQIVEVIDHVVRRHGRRVRFIEHQEALERFNKNLLAGVPLRTPGGGDGGVRILDVNNDGHVDVLLGSDDRRETRLWDPTHNAWRVGGLPFHIDARVRFGVLQSNGHASALILNEDEPILAHFTGETWQTRRPEELAGVDPSGFCFRDVDADGISELLVNNTRHNVIHRWNDETRRFQLLRYALPGLGNLVGAEGEDRGLRFADLDLDRHLDLVLSNQDEFYVRLFEPPDRGWTRRVLAGRAGALGALPVIADQGRSMGAWIRERKLYVANEATARLPDLVATRDFARMVEHMPSRPLEVQEAVSTLRLPAGFEARLFAAEPMVISPVAMDFGPDGRVWVVEMPSYPLDGVGGGRVKILRDRDADGRADEARVFATGLSFPTGALWHGRGVLVTCAPDILYLEDTDGDDSCDLRRVVFTGFGEGNQQHRVNGLHWSIDGWIYGANGDSGGDITTLNRPGPPLRLGSRDFRFLPDFSRFEAESGHTQFGLALDDFGRRLGASNVRHLLHAVLPDRYLARNPHWAAPDVVIDAPEHGAMARIFPISRALLTLNDIHVPGHFSSACGVTIYRGSGFPAAYRGSAFVCEPVGNVVHRDVLMDDGAVIRSRRGENDHEFLASTDNWFRPVYCTTGPDDALYVVDMYRFIIEHPQYIPEPIQQILDFDAGRDRGRIWRIVAVAPSTSTTPRPLQASGLMAASSPELAACLDHPNGWWRDTAQRLLLDRRDASVVPALRTLATSSSLAASRAQALWTLAGLDALDEDLLLAALADPSPAVREEALRLAEPRLGTGQKLLQTVLEKIRDENFRVRFQTALTLGASDRIEAGEALARLLQRDGHDRWMRAAILSSSLPHAARILAALFASDQPPVDSPHHRDAFEALVSTLLHQGNWAQVQDLVSQPATPATVHRWHLRLLGALEDAAGRGVDLARGFDVVRAVAVDRACDRTQPTDLRLDAIRAAGSGLAGPPGSSLLDPRESPEIQLAAVRALARAGQTGSAAALTTILAAWPQAGPVVRGEILESLVGTRQGGELLLEAVQQGRIEPHGIDARARERLAAIDGGRLREISSQILPRIVSNDRQRAVALTLAALGTLRGEPTAGREVFRQTCAPCHRLDGEGFEVGPDLAEARAKGEAALVEAIVNPGGMVPPRYTVYEVLTERGVATGIVVSETATAVTLRRAGGVEETILRSEVRDLKASSQSLMPLEIEKTMPPQALADLLAFLAVQPRGLGSITELDAGAARAELIASGHNGLASVRRAQGRDVQPSWVGRLEMHYVRQLDGAGVLEWQTKPVPADLDAGGQYRFRFAAAMGYVSQPAGNFALYLGEKHLLDFNVSLQSTTWHNESTGARLLFHVRARDGEDATGPMTLELPARLLQPGKAAILRVTGSSAQSRRWFGVLPLQ